MWREFEDSASKTVVSRLATDRHTHTHTHRQTHRQTDTQTDRQNRLHDSCQSEIGNYKQVQIISKRQKIKEGNNTTPVDDSCKTFS